MRKKVPTSLLAACKLKEDLVVSLVNYKCKHTWAKQAPSTPTDTVAHSRTFFLFSLTGSL